MDENQKNMEHDQLRPQTTNEVISDVSGQQGGAGQNQSAEEGSGRSYDYGSPNDDTARQGTGAGQQQGTASRGATTDTDAGSIGGPSRGAGDDRDSGLATKRSVTGSDFDGQNSI